MKEFQITENEAGQRFDKYLAKLLRNAPKSFFYKMLRKKNITLNGRKATGATEATRRINNNGAGYLFYQDDGLTNQCRQFTFELPAFYGAFHPVYYFAQKFIVFEIK